MSIYTKSLDDGKHLDASNKPSCQLTISTTPTKPAVYILPTPSLAKLPSDILLRLFHFLSFPHLLQLRHTCRSLNHLLLHHEHHHFRVFENVKEFEDRLSCVAKCFVERCFAEQERRMWGWLGKRTLGKREGGGALGDKEGMLVFVRVAGCENKKSGKGKERERGVDVPDANSSCRLDNLLSDHVSNQLSSPAPRARVRLLAVPDLCGFPPGSTLRIHAKSECEVFCPSTPLAVRRLLKLEPAELKVSRRTSSYSSVDEDAPYCDMKPSKEDSVDVTTEHIIPIKTNAWTENTIESPVSPSFPSPPFPTPIDVSTALYIKPDPHRLRQLLRTGHSIEFLADGYIGVPQDEDKEEGSDDDEDGDAGALLGIFSEPAHDVFAERRCCEGSKVEGEFRLDTMTKVTTHEDDGSPSQEDCLVANTLLKAPGPASSTSSPCSNSTQISIKGSERGEACVAIIDDHAGVELGAKKVARYLRMLKRRWVDLYG
ncbi:hypothetical protein HDV05_001936 [Chytridiales sp. JEL 0842]|nr:hypothetical protein HDV05_001936 [Chytridiales sp. JEL 0842]